MRKRSHGVEEVGSATRASRNRGTSLLIGCVSVTHRNDQAGFPGGVDTRSRPEHFRGDRQHSGIPGGGLEHAVEHLRRRRLDPFGWMNSAALLADKRPLQVDPQNFRAGFIRFVLSRDVTSYALNGAESFIGSGCNGRGHQGGRAVFRDLASDGAHRGAASLHDVVPASTVDVHIQKPRNRRLSACANFLPPRGQCHSRAWPDCFDHIFSNQDARVVDFCCWG